MFTNTDSQGHSTSSHGVTSPDNSASQRRGEALAPVSGTEPKRRDRHEKAPGRQLVLTRASDVPMRPARWIWENRILLGGLTLLAGREGLGKSTLAVDLAAQVTRGKLPGEMFDDARTVIYVNSEDARDYTIVPRLSAAGADLDHVIFLDAVTPDETVDGLVLPLDTDLLAKVVSEHEAALVVLDAATSVIDGHLNGDKDRQMRQALEAIGRMAEQCGAAVLGIVHFGKANSTDTGKLILGSIAWSQVARSTLAVARDDTGRLVISTTKANLAPVDTPSLAARLVGEVVHTPEGPTEVGRVEWLGETERDALELLGPPENPEKNTECTAAGQWLGDFLANARPQKSGDVKKAGKAAGFSESTLARARRTLGVLVTSEGFPRVSYWSMPDSGASAADDRACADKGGTTGTTGGDLHKPNGTTGGRMHCPGTTGENSPTLDHAARARLSASEADYDNIKRKLEELFALPSEYDF